jgi:glycerophosphoryl diester phosphodiesterase
MARIAPAFASLLLLAAPALAFDLQGHRGARGLAPENTLPAFAQALSLGVTTLELDLAVTKDGQLVVAHDRRLNPDITRSSNGSWIASPGPTVTSLTLAEVKQYDVGRIKPGTDYAKTFAEQRGADKIAMPLFAEVVALARKAGSEVVRFNIETKLSPLASAETVDPEAFARAAIAEVRRLGIERRTTIQSFDWRTLAIVAREAPEIERVYLTLERGANDNVWKGRNATSPWTGLNAADHGNRTPRLVQAAGGRIWSPNFRDLDAATLAEAKSLGLSVVVWTINDAAEMERHVDMGVDGIITDRPDRLREVLIRKRVAVPAATPVTAD